MPTVTIPNETGVTLKLVPKLIVPAIPRFIESLSLMSIPAPTPVNPVSSEPSPENLVAVTTPVTSTPE